MFQKIQCHLSEDLIPYESKIVLNMLLLIIMQELKLIYMILCLHEAKSNSKYLAIYLFWTQKNPTNFLSQKVSIHPDYMLPMHSKKFFTFINFYQRLPFINPCSNFFDSSLLYQRKLDLFLFSHLLTGINPTFL